MKAKDNISIVIVGDETYIYDAPYDTKIKTLTGETVLPDDESSYSYQKYSYVFSEGDTLFHVLDVEKSVTYTAREGQSSKLKFEIDEATYALIPSALKALYEKVTHKEEEETAIDTPIVLTDLNAYSVAVPELVIYGKSEVIRNLATFNFTGVNKQAMVEGRIGTTYHAGELTVKFFKEPYTGAMRKVPSLKQNGRPYADGRGRVFNDYPKVIDSITIPEIDIPEFSASNQKDMDAQMQAYFDHITMTHMLAN